MANAARRDLREREVLINREKLIKILRENMAIHIKEYEEAVEGYQDELLKRIEEGYSKAKVALDAAYKKIKGDAETLNKSEISKRLDHMTFIPQFSVSMPVPKLYKNEYQIAIDIAEHDVRDNLELTYAEFVCFVKDEWDWKEEFVSISTMYKKMG